MRIHELKTYPCYFEETLKGNKSFEIRFNDRDFQAGDRVILKEWDHVRYTGREIRGTIKYIIGDRFEGLAKGYVAFAFGADPAPEAEKAEDLLGQICNSYCKYPNVCRDEEELMIICHTCPLEKLAEMVDEEYE